ncbi:threonine aldolase family protein [Granulicella sibirica]|uniref:Low-specificity L-threonine aldolase n=1 Tax=Granulicella sibirica TaxID=2479048 RepID=A0A4Q0T2X2_9BACT|nr:GntG family PLP-dependent aldolase [Granulicella sibirica]RXH55856.1 Low-specificity L-threonine aldolase [Granulicella sibirica]
MYGLGTAVETKQVEGQIRQPVDLRSDTVTKPTDAMREAMASAEVGDDVYGEDPTVNRLEARAAEVFGREAALFVPTGSMGNQIAIRLHTQHGQEVICEARSHVLDWEMAMMAAFSGCQARAVAAERGILTWEHIKPAIGAKIYYRAQTGLICLENSHNMAGGTVTPVEVMREIWDGAKDARLPVHLDGARVFNAATALGVSVAELTEGFDTVMFCLSKGLGAPVGSMLVGSGEAIEQARMHRKALGGGMRQAGVLAAAGLIALEEMPAVLTADHANARMLAGTVARFKSAEIDLGAVQTNIVIFTLVGNGDAAAFVGRLKARGVLASATGPHAVRFVTHHDVTLRDCERAAGVVAEELEGLG